MLKNRNVANNFIKKHSLNTSHLKDISYLNIL